MLETYTIVVARETLSSGTIEVVATSDAEAARIACYMAIHRPEIVAWDAESKSERAEAKKVTKA